MIYYSYNEFERDVKKLAIQVRAEFNPDAIVAIARGGMTIGHYMAIALESRNLFALNSIHYDDVKKLDTVDVFNIPNLAGFKKILIVDDIIDSGESMVEIKRVLKQSYPDAEFKIATLFFKHHALVKPEFTINEASDWIEFCWDIKI